MFDWNDEELTNIIWDEATESDDHIVPYQEGSENFFNKKEWSEQYTTVRPSEQKLPGAKVDLHGRKPGSSSSLNPTDGISTPEFGMGSWSELSVSNNSKTNQDSMGAKVSSNLSEITKYSSTSAAGTNGFDEEPVFENLHEGKEQGDFVDYSWANVGSFDDLDRIFSNDDPIFGHVNLPSTDELWSSSKDDNSPVKSFPSTGGPTSLGLGLSRSTNENSETKTQSKQRDDHSFTLSYGRIVDPASHVMQNAEYPGDKSKATAKKQANVRIRGRASATKSCPTAVKAAIPNQVTDKPKLLKCRKREAEIAEGKLLPDFYGSWAPSESTMGLNANQLAFSSSKSFPSLVMSQQTQHHASDTVQHKHISDTFEAHATYQSHINPYQAMPVVSGIQLKETPAKTSTMTPQEKIEKLRRRQQMQALLAIQKQQQQFSHQVPLTGQSVAQRSSQEDQARSVEGADIDEISALPPFDPNSPLEQDDSNTVSVTVDDYSGEDKVLHRLQDVVSKLDVRIRLCIRDSLFRLAQSAMQRHYTSDTSSTNKGGRDDCVAVAKEETKSLNRIADMETETNPIDRTVAHFLFHQPLEFPTKHPDTPESPASSKLSCARKAGNFLSPLIQCRPENALVQQNVTYQGSKNLCPLAHLNSNCPFIDSSDYASNYAPAPAEGGAIETNEGQSNNEVL